MQPKCGRGLRSTGPGLENEGVSVRFNRDCVASL
jgi:hypothetical protein